MSSKDVQRAAEEQMQDEQMRDELSAEDAARVQQLRALVRARTWDAASPYERLRMANEYRNYLMQKEFGFNPFPPSFLSPSSPEAAAPACRGRAPRQKQGRKGKGVAGPRANGRAPSKGFDTPRSPTPFNAGVTAARPAALAPLQLVKKEVVDPPESYFGEETFPSSGIFIGFSDEILKRCRELVRGQRKALQRAHEKEGRLQRRRRAEELNPPTPSDDIRVVFPEDDDLYQVRVKKEPPSSADEEEEGEKENEEKENEEKEKEGGAAAEDASVRAGPYSLRKRKPTDYRELPLPDDDEFLYCDECEREWEGDCPEHGPLLLLADAPAARSLSLSLSLSAEEQAAATAPPELAVAPSSIPGAGRGVWARVALPRALRMGPYRGARTRRENELGYSWEIRRGGRRSHFVDAGDARCANWMRFVNCARHQQEQNVVAFQFRGAIFYRSARALAPHEELLVWYGAAFARQLGISPRDFRAPLLRPLPRRAFPCRYCSISFSSPLFQEAHMQCCRHKWKNTTSADTAETTTSIQHKNDGSVTRNLSRTDNSSCDFRRVNDKCDVYKEGPTSKDTKLNRVDGQSKLQRDKLVRTGERSHRCDECSASFNSPCNLKRHKRIHSGERPYRCEECGAAFTESGHLKTHRRTHSGERPYRCEECGAAFSQSGTLKKHKRTHSGERPYRCKECGAAFTVSGSLKKHKRTHSGERPYRCEECGAAFRQSGDLKKHKRTHSGERPYRCDECGAAFTTSGNIERHKRTHSGERPYRCEECGAAFTESGHLKTHKRIHSGERPYRCEECGAAFTVSGHLKKHKRIHSGERPYRCEECGAAFTESGHLKKHKRIHSGERPYRCEECGAAFTESGSLKKHKRTHSGERPYRCEECGASFCRLQSLNIHRRKKALLSSQCAVK